MLKINLDIETKFSVELTEDRLNDILCDIQEELKEQIQDTIMSIVNDELDNDLDLDKTNIDELVKSVAENFFRIELKIPKVKKKK